MLIYPRGTLKGLLLRDTGTLPQRDLFKIFYSWLCFCGLVTVAQDRHVAVLAGIPAELWGASGHRALRRIEVRNLVRKSGKKKKTLLDPGRS